MAAPRDCAELAWKEESFTCQSRVYWLSVMSPRVSKIAITPWDIAELFRKVQFWTRKWELASDRGVKTNPAEVDKAELVVMLALRRVKLRTPDKIPAVP